MRAGVMLLAAATLLTCCASLGAQRQQRAPITTKWASQVDSANPLPEYPRPQMVRKDWLNLNGIWQFQSGMPDEPVPEGRLKSRIVVPFPVESDLSGVMLHFDRLWYRRTFEIPAGWAGKHVLLHFGAVDYETEVFINGKSVGTHKGGYDPFTFDITSALGASEQQDILVCVYDPTDEGGQPRGKQIRNPGGIDYTPTTGIWQTVWLEPVDTASIQDLKIVPDVDKSELHLTVNTRDQDGAATVHVVVKDGDDVVGHLDGKANTALSIAIPKPKLWSPDSPFLYGLEVTLNDGGKDTDQVSSYFGMRKISIGKVGKYNRILLNNQPVFELGPLDQGFWPDGIYTPPSDAAIESDIATMKSMGFNMVRKHEKVEPARWYYWTDKLGLLVWQDMPSPNAYPDRAEVVPPVDKPEFETELKRMVETHWNSPSIILWTVFNEGQGQFDTGRLVSEVKALDPSRLVNEASGGKITGAGDLNDLHTYPEPGVRTPTPNQALVLGEFGGISYYIKGHSWEQSGFGHINVETPNDLVYLYGEYMQKVKYLRDNAGLSAAVFTQLTDVMTEINGLMTYDRVPKAEIARIAEANHFTLAMPTYAAIVPTSEEAAQAWKYTTTKPSDEWAMPDYSDAQWTAGKGGFGDAKHQGATPWTTSDIWLRRHFNPGTLSIDEIANLVVKEYNVGEVEIYINGVSAFSLTARNSTRTEGSEPYEYRAVSNDSRASIKIDSDNVLAIHCMRGGADQFIDAGLAVRVIPDK
jgi:hypothetical protein